MSAKDIASVIARAVGDPEFADLLFTDPDRALAGYDVTEEEAALFRNNSGPEAGTSPAAPELRASMGIMGDGDPW